MSGYVDYGGKARRNRAPAALRFGKDGGLAEKLSHLPWGLISLIVALAILGTAVLYSSTITNPGEADLPAKHLMRFALCFPMMIALALTPLKLWMRLAFPAYGLALLLLVGVELVGVSGGGAQRWLQMGPVRLQPSEFMKLALTLGLARYYQMTLSSHQGGGLLTHIGAAIITLAPAALILKQPDLGTTLTVVACGGVTIYFAGLRWRVILPLAGLGVVAVPLAYLFALEPYQRKRVETLWNPGADPLGAGYQSEQAKIAIGSGGWDGKGFTQGTQSQLDYIPEQHTDFIYTVVAEEFGFLGAVGLLALWAAIIVWGLVIAGRSTSLFGRFAAASAVATIAFYVTFNVGMVTGLLPVVGIPMPLISYGGTAMVTVMAAFGLILSVHLHRDDKLAARGLI